MSRYDSMSEQARFHLSNNDEIELAEMVASSDARIEQLKAERATLALIFEGFGRLLATSARDWQTYAPDAWLYAVICGWDCEQSTHDGTCTHGALEETAEMHGWDAAAIAKARRYRAAVRALQPRKETPDA